MLFLAIMPESKYANTKTSVLKNGTEPYFVKTDMKANNQTNLRAAKSPRDALSHPNSTMAPPPSAPRPLAEQLRLWQTTSLLLGCAVAVLALLLVVQ